MPTIKDTYGRPLYHIRVSVTQRCDLNCFYCHREGQDIATNEMTPTEISKIVKVASEFGINKAKITGGEPLLRPDLPEIIHSISNIRDIEEVSLVTNARILTYDKATKLKNKGLTRININLPSHHEETYRKIVGMKLKPTLEGIKASVKSGLFPVKINMVLLKGLNDNEVYSMIDFVKGIGAILQLIELEPLKINETMYMKYFLPLENIESEIAKAAKKIETRKIMQNRSVYTLGDGAKVEFVRPVDNTEFCLHCTRIRLTSNGKIKPCLMSDDGLVDVLDPIRSAATENKLRESFLKAVKLRKPYYTAQKFRV